MRPWCDVPAAASSAKPAPRATQRRRTCALSVWGGGAAGELATCARRGALVVLGRHFVEERRAGEKHLSFGMRPWCDVPAAASSATPAPRVIQLRCTCALCVWGGGAARELATRARRGALVVLEGRFVQGRRAGERHLSIGVWPCCDIQATAFNTKSAPRVLRGTGAPALVVSREEAQHTSLLRVRAVPRCIWSDYAPQKGAAAARGLSPSRHDCGTTRYLQPLIPGQRRMSRLCMSRDSALAITREKVPHSFLPCARLVALFAF